MEQDIGWKQRFLNFEKAFFQLKKAVNETINSKTLIEHINRTGKIFYTSKL